MRVGYFQFRPAFGKVDDNASLVLDALREVNADLIVLPELAFTGYTFKDRAELERLAEDPLTSPVVQELSWLAAARNMHVVTGFAEKAGSQVFNSALLIGPLGVMQTYRKLHLFAEEKELFDPGDGPLEVCQVRDTQVALMVCFDWAFPELARVLTLAGADILCHPANLVLSHCQQAMRTRCLENGVFAITANRYGVEKRAGRKLRFTGRSQIVGPDGELLHQAQAQRKTLEIREIDPRLARDKRMGTGNHLLRDRRPEHYQGLNA